MKLLPRWWRSHFLHVEFGVAVLGSLAFAGWVELSGGAGVVNTLLNGNRGMIYGTFASIFGSLLGFAITAASIILGFSGLSRLAIIRESAQYPTLWRVFKATIRALGLATIVSLIGLILSHETTLFRWVLHVSVFASLLACLRLIRCVWVLEKTIGLLTAPSKARPSSSEE